MSDPARELLERMAKATGWPITRYERDSRALVDSTQGGFWVGIGHYRANGSSALDLTAGALSCMLMRDFPAEVVDELLAIRSDLLPLLEQAHPLSTKWEP